MTNKEYFYKGQRVRKLEYIYYLSQKTHQPTMSAPVRGVLTLLRSGLTVGDVLIEPGSLTAVGLTGSLNNRGQVEAFSIRSGVGSINHKQQQSGSQGEGIL